MADVNHEIPDRLPVLDDLIPLARNNAIVANWMSLKRAGRASLEEALIGCCVQLARQNQVFIDEKIAIVGDRIYFDHCTTREEVEAALTRIGRPISPSDIPSRDELKRRNHLKQEMLRRGIDPNTPVRSLHQ